MTNATGTGHGLTKARIGKVVNVDRFHKKDSSGFCKSAKWFQAIVE